MPKKQPLFFQKLTPSKVFLLLLISFSIGIFVAHLWQIGKLEQNILFSILILSIIIFILFYRENLLKILAIFLIGTSIGGWYFGYYSIKNVPQNLPYDKQVTVVGIINNEPDERENKTKLKVVILESKEYSQLIDQKILVDVPQYPQYQYGDKLEITGKLEKPGEFKIADQDKTFDYGEYLARDKIYALINLTDSFNPEKISGEIKIVGHNNGNWFLAGIYNIKNKFQNTINRILPEPLSALLDGLLLGSRRSIPIDLMTAFNIVGLTHIIAISGYNITIIIDIFAKTTKHWSKRLSFLLGIFGLITFVILTGAQASVVRASVMAFLFLLARQLGRKGNLVIALTFVACIMLIINPMILRFDIGFQLSFMAVLGLIYITPIFEKLLSRWPKLINESMSATLGAQIMTIPILLFNFGRLSLIAPIANVLVLPIIPVTMAIGFISTVVGLINIYLGQIFAWIPWIFLKYIVVITEYLSKIPFASIEFDFSKWYLVTVYYIVLIGIIVFVQKRQKCPKTI